MYWKWKRNNHKWIFPFVLELFSLEKWTPLAHFFIKIRCRFQIPYRALLTQTQSWEWQKKVQIRRYKFIHTFTFTFSYSNVDASQERKQNQKHQRDYQSQHPLGNHFTSKVKSKRPYNFTNTASSSRLHRHSEKKSGINAYDEVHGTT